MSRDYEGDDRRKKEGWHVGKEIPIALIVMLLLQSGGGIWWAATISAEMRALKEKVNEFTVNQFTSAEARAMISANTQHNTEQDRRMSSLEQRMRELEQEHRAALPPPPRR